MNVLIDASNITRQKAGVGVYAKNLIGELVRDTAIQFFLVAQNDDPDLEYSRWPNVRMLWVPSRLLRTVPLRLIFEQTGLPYLLRKHKIDVVHSLHYSFPLIGFGAKRVVTIHDMTSFSMRDYIPAFKGRYYRYYIRKSVRRADALIFVSESAQRDYLTRFGRPHGRMDVIYHGKSETLTPCADPAASQSVQHKYSLPPRYVLYIGTIEPRKNLTRLVEAYAGIAASYPEVPLVIAGMKGWMYADLFARVRQLNLQDRVLFPGFLAEQDKYPILCAAEVFTYVSLYEGFGLPVLEAMACGVPTLTSQTSSLPEVAGDAALLVDPHNVEEIAAALQRLLSDAELRQWMREASLHQAAKFTWTKSAEQTICLYRAVHERTRASHT